MLMFAFVAFVISLAGIVALFCIKYFELNREKVFLPRLREQADIRAGQVKELLVAARADLAQLVPLTVRLSQYLVHESALAFAALARTAEKAAHQLAELVSSKRRFEKRETRSEFLKKVSEHKNGNGNGNGLPSQRLDTTSNNGQNS